MAKRGSRDDIKQKKIYQKIKIFHEFHDVIILQYLVNIFFDFQNLATKDRKIAKAKRMQKCQ